MKTPFIGQAYTARSKNLACDRLLNLYPEMAPEGKDVAALFGTPGLEQLFQIGDGPIRGALNYFNVTWFVVSGTTLYYTDSLLTTPLSIGTIAGTGRVSMVANLEQKVFIVAGANAYIYDLATSTLSLVSLPPTNGTCDFIDSYFVFPEEGTAFFYLYDGVTFDVLDVGVAEGMPDHIETVLADPAGLWLFCGLHTEVWQDTGDADFPFQRLPGGLIPQGCASKFTPKRLDNSIFWLGRNEDGQGMVWKINGYSPVRVSTYAIELAIQSYGDISDAFAQTYQQDGHSFYALTFPSAGATWVLDVSNGLWQERASVDPNTGALSRWRPNSITAFQGEIVAGDWASGKVFSLSLDNYTDGKYGPVTGFTPVMSSTSTTLNSQLACATVLSSSIGFLRTEILTVEGGTYTRPAKVMVANDTTGGTGVVNALAVVDAGDYIELPDSPMLLTGGSGTLLVANVYFTASDQVVIAPESGAGFTPTPPTISFDTTYGTGAAATATLQLICAIPTQGINYVVGDILTLSGGTHTTAAKVKVEAVSSGQPTALSIHEPGVYSVKPTGFVTLTGGSGTLATAICICGIGNPILTAGGTAYSRSPPIVISGTGVGAQLVAEVDATTNYIKAARAWRPLPQGHNNLKRTFHHSLTLDCESGVGLGGVGLGTDPQIGLRWSDDGGHTWGNWHYRKLGKIGKTGTRVIWRRLGSTEKLRDRVYEVSMTDPVPRAFIAADIDLSAGTS